jgi:ElaB/YqjD/DUF883 family membrane-anchored ribosome-binding protein
VDDERELEVIRHQMEATRSSLATKIEDLESQVMRTVQTATDTVSSAVEGAKDVVSSVSEGAKDVVEKVSETVESVKESLNVSHYVERYPWASLGVSVAAGFALAQLLPARRSSSGDYDEALPPASSGEIAPPSPSPSPPREEGSAVSNALSGAWHTAVSTVEGLAVGTLMSAIKELAVRSLPQEWQSELNRMVDDVTNRLGGKVMHGNPMQELLSAFRPNKDDNQQNGPATDSGTNRPAGQGVRT